jgi:uncharacterized protein YjbI with pentapeptide repeats
MDISPNEFARLSRDHAGWLVHLRSQLDESLPGKLSLQQSCILGVHVNNLDYTGAVFASSTMRNCVFCNCAFHAADFVGVVLEDCIFSECSLYKCDLVSASAIGCAFNRCDFTRADLTDANFAGTNFDGSVFDWAWFLRTDLRQTSLNNVQFVASRFMEAKMYNDGLYHFATIRDVVGEIDMDPYGLGCSVHAATEALASLARTQ